MNQQATGFLVVSACESTRRRIDELLNAFPYPCTVTCVTQPAELMMAPSDGIDVAVVDDRCGIAEGFCPVNEFYPSVPVIRISPHGSPDTAMDPAGKGEMILPLDQLDEGPFFRIVGWALEHKSLLSDRNAGASSTPNGESPDSLEDAVWRLEGRDRERIDLIVNTSHELRTPLTAMLYGLGNLLKGVADPVSEKQRVYLGMLRAECQRMLSTVEAILDVQQADAGEVELNTVPLLFFRLVERCVASLGEDVREREIIVEVLTVPGFIACDPHMMQRAVVNVLQNALRFSPFGGTITVSLTEDEGQFLLSIVDEGKGIEPQYLERVTEPYFQVDGQIEGTGLGLSITKEILERHGGALAVASPPVGKEGCGTQVTLRIPVAPPPKALAVDDSPTIRAALMQQLSRAGYEVTLASDGREALEFIEQEKPDVLIVDSVMPEMNGEELILELKSRHDQRTLPMVMLTGAEVDRWKRSFLEGFGIPAIGKPWNASELVGCVDDVIVGKGYLKR